MKKILILLSILLIGLAGCQSRQEPEPTLSPTPVPTKTIFMKIDAALEAGDLGALQALMNESTAPLNRGDVDGAMTYFTDDAVYKLVPAIPPGSPDTFAGKDVIRTWFEELMVDNFEIEVKVLKIEGDTVTTETKSWSNATRAIGVAPLVATEVYIYQDGKIKSAIWTISDESLAALQTAATPAITVEDLVGTWRWEGPVGVGPVDSRYHQDGTYELIRYIVDSEVLWDAGTIEIDGNLLTYVSSEDSGYCEVGQRGSYEMSLTEDGQLKVALVEDECWRRRPPVEGPIFTSPYSP